MSIIRSTLLLLCLVLLGSSPGAAADDATARELINSQGCKGCHRIEQDGGSLGPDLKGVGKRLTREALRRQLLDPQGRQPGSIMPSSGHLTTPEIEALIDYLAGLK